MISVKPGYYEWNAFDGRGNFIATLGDMTGSFFEWIGLDYFKQLAKESTSEIKKRCKDLSTDFANDLVYCAKEEARDNEYFNSINSRLLSISKNQEKDLIKAVKNIVADDFMQTISLYS